MWTGWTFFWMWGEWDSCGVRGLDSSPKGLGLEKSWRHHSLPMMPLTRTCCLRGISNNSLQVTWVECFGPTRDTFQCDQCCVSDTVTVLLSLCVCGVFWDWEHSWNMRIMQCRQWGTYQGCSLLGNIPCELVESRCARWAIILIRFKETLFFICIFKKRVSSDLLHFLENDTKDERWMDARSYPKCPV